MRITYIQVQNLRKQAAAPAEPVIKLPPVPMAQATRVSTPRAPMQTVAPKPTFTDDEVRFYNAVQHVETGGLKNPWIRAIKAGKDGSSAYGPVQITQRKAKDYLNRFPKMMAGSVDFYNTTLGPMHQLFLKYGREPNKPGYDPKWDYGGYGKILTPAEKDAYRNMGLMMMRVDADEARRLLPKGTPEELFKKRMELWHGMEYEADPDYFDRLLDYYNKH